MIKLRKFKSYRSPVAQVCVAGCPLSNRLLTSLQHGREGCWQMNLFGYMLLTKVGAKRCLEELQEAGKAGHSYLATMHQRAHSDGSGSDVLTTPAWEPELDPPEPT